MKAGTDVAGVRVGVTRRLAAVAAVVLVVAVLVSTVFSVLGDPLVFAAQVALIVVGFLFAWGALTHEGFRRRAAVAVAVVAVAGLLWLQVWRENSSLLSIALRIALLGVALLLATFALRRDARSLKASATPGRPVPPARRGVLIMNLKSGGGKAEKFRLEDKCRARGIEPVVLHPGDDLLRLAHDAVDRGADVLGMAGGDGSQALVSSVASQRGVPMVVVPAGTRNHFALDIGLDRDDVVGALDAFGEAHERVIDLADVNGRVFVNNVSLGLYATIVQSPEYRDAKRETTLAALPEMLGPGSEPFDLRFTTPEGEAVEGAHVVQVSNDPYGTTATTMTSRPRLDTGELGILSLVVPDAASATRAIAALTTGRPEIYPGYRTWTSPGFEVTSEGRIAVGLDGEALEMDPPLVFASRPGALRLRLPAGAIGYSPAARALHMRDLLHLWDVMLGRPVPLGDRVSSGEGKGSS